MEFSYFPLEVGKCFLNNIGFQTLQYFKSSPWEIGHHLQVSSPHFIGKEAEAERFPDGCTLTEVKLSQCLGLFSHLNFERAIIVSALG